MRRERNVFRTKPKIRQNEMNSDTCVTRTYDIALPTSINVSIINLRVTGSRKTSNSSITRKGVSNISPRANKRAIVLQKRGEK